MTSDRLRCRHDNHAFDAASADSFIALMSKWGFYAFNSATFLQSSRIAFGITLRQYCFMFRNADMGLPCRFYLDIVYDAPYYRTLLSPRLPGEHI